MLCYKGSVYHPETLLDYIQLRILYSYWWTVMIKSRLYKTACVGEYDAGDESR